MCLFSPWLLCKGFKMHLSTWKTKIARKEERTKTIDSTTCRKTKAKNTSKERCARIPARGELPRVNPGRKVIGRYNEWNFGKKKRKSRKGRNRAGWIEALSLFAPRKMYNLTMSIYSWYKMRYMRLTLSDRGFLRTKSKTSKRYYF